MHMCVAYINFQFWFDATTCVNFFQFIPVFQDVKRSVFRIAGIIPMVSKHLTNTFCRNINILIASLQRKSDHHFTIVYYCIHHTEIDNFWPENFPLPQTALNIYQNMTHPQMMVKWWKYAIECQKVNWKFMLMMILFWNLSIILSFDIKTTALWQKGLLTSSDRQVM